MKMCRPVGGTQHQANAHKANHRINLPLEENYVSERRQVASLADELRVSPEQIIEWSGRTNAKATSMLNMGEQERVQTRFEQFRAEQGEANSNGSAPRAEVPSQPEKGEGEPGPEAPTASAAPEDVSSQEMSDASPGSETQVSEPDAASQTQQPATMVNLVREYKGKGLQGVQADDMRWWLTELRKQDVNKPLSPEVEERLRAVLNVLTAVCEQLDQDKAMLKDWTPPTSDNIHRELDNNTRTLVNMFRFQGICGHQVVQSQANMQERLANDNDKVSPFLRLCADCAAVRIALLDLVPGSARHDSLCGICSKSTFRLAGDEGRTSHARSRGDIWENLISDVSPIALLPMRLNPDHGANHQEHKRLAAASQQEFEAWRETYETQVAAVIAQLPQRGAELKAQMAKDIEAKQNELGLIA